TSGGFLPPSLSDFPRPCPLNHSFSLSKQKADKPGDKEVETRADHHAAHSAEQHEDVGLTKQHPDDQSADEAANDAGDREAPGKPDVTSLTHVCCAAAHGDRRNFSTKNLVSITRTYLKIARRSRSAINVG